ncbi:MAG: N-acetylmuramoyl-L-alanine amidase [Actinomycetota bacterium]
MRLFKKKKEGEELFEGQDSSTDADTPVEEEHTVAGAAGPESAEPEPDEDEEAAAAPAPAHPGRGFFDLAPDEVAGYHAPAPLMVPRRKIPWKPIAKVVGIVAALGLVVVLVVLLWPSPGKGLPDYVGKTVTEAMDSARSLGYHPEVSSWEYSHKHSDGVVLEQSPAPGKGVAPGEEVKLVVSKGARPEAEPTVTIDTGANSSTPPVNPFAAKVVLIDPGHQSLPAENEWSDPDMTRRVPGEPSLRGISTGNLEDRVALDIATKLNTLLGKDGVTVVMTRDKGDIDLPQTTRAEMANDSKANLFIRIHMAGSKDPMMSGVVTLYPAKTKYTKDFYEKSKAAALLIQQELVKATGATDYGVEDRHDHVSFNWSHVPVVESEVGYLTSPADDLSLDDDAYRWKVAQGLRNGVIKFLQTK